MCFNELSTGRLESANPCRVSTDGRNTQRVSGPAYSATFGLVHMVTESL